MLSITNGKLKFTNFALWFLRTKCGSSVENGATVRTRVVNLRLDKLGRSGPQILVDWAGPVGPEFHLGRAVQAQNFCRPGRAVFCQYSAKISPIFRHFLKQQCVIWNELIIKFKFSLKNLSKIRIEIKLGMTGPARPEDLQPWSGPPQRPIRSSINYNRQWNLHDWRQPKPMSNYKWILKF